eukprot:scaffold73_cov118-Cylindrotheca_fusiformis.AAC.8
MADSRTSHLLAFVAGAVATMAVTQYISKKGAKNAGATAEGDDLSLYYGDIQRLTTIPDSRRYLPSEIYGELVRKCVVCCVDVVIVRKYGRLQKKQCVLVERASDPAKGVWWWPGGRLLKGESFFDAAIRKAHQETGLDPSDMTPIQMQMVEKKTIPCISWGMEHVLPNKVGSPWGMEPNLPLVSGLTQCSITFQRTNSAWDTETDKGTQTVNAIVLVELSRKDTNVVLDEQSERWRWIPVDPKVAKQNNEDKYVVEALERLKTWNPYY